MEPLEPVEKHLKSFITLSELQWVFTWTNQIFARRTRKAQKGKTVFERFITPIT